MQGPAPSFLPFPRPSRPAGLLRGLLLASALLMPGLAAAQSSLGGAQGSVPRPVAPGAAPAPAPAQQTPPGAPPRNLQPPGTSQTAPVAAPRTVTRTPAVPARPATPPSQTRPATAGATPPRPAAPAAAPRKPAAPAPARAATAGAAAVGAAALGAAAVTTPPAAAVPAAPSEPPPPAIGPNTGLPLPRFAALRSDEVNMRTGPGTRFPIEWTYQRRDLPVEITREFQEWRRIRDMDGTEGWVHQATLAGRRTFMVRGLPGSEITLYRKPEAESGPVARMRPGVIGRLRACPPRSDWCEAQVADHRGYIRRGDVWGIGPEESIN